MKNVKGRKFLRILPSAMTALKNRLLEKVADVSKGMRIGL